MPDLTWDSGTDTWDSDTDTWDAPVIGPPAPDEDPAGPLSGAFLKREFPKAPPTGVYRFLVGDLLTGSIVDEIPFATATYGFLRNRPGGMSVDVPRTNDHGRPFPQVSRSVLDPGATALYVERDGVILWGGIIWAAEPQEKIVKLGGEGFWSHFRKIRHEGTPDPGRPDHNRLKRYNDVDQFDIVRDVIRYAQTYYPDTDLGVIVDDHLSGTVRDQVYRPWDRLVIAESIEKMAELNNGFDFSLDVAWEGDRIVKRLHLFSSRGRRTEIVFDDHKNCALRSRTIDAADAVRQVTATGSGSGASLRRATYAESTLAGQRPFYQDVVSWSEVEDISTLESRAVKQVERRKRPMETIALSVTPQADLPLGAWRVGDYVRVRIDDPYESVDSDMRVVGWEVEVDEEGQEGVNMDFGPIPA